MNLARYAVAVLLVYGAMSSRWLDESVGPTVIHEGPAYSEVCGFGVGDDDLEAFGEAQRTGKPPPVEPWECEREINVAQVGKLRGGADILYWSLTLLCVLAGLATAGLLALRRRGVVPAAAVALAVALGLLGFAFADGTPPSSVSFGAAAYLTGAIAAIVIAIRAKRRAA